LTELQNEVKLTRKHRQSYRHSDHAGSSSTRL